MNDEIRTLLNQINERLAPQAPAAVETPAAVATVEPGVKTQPEAATAPAAAVATSPVAPAVDVAALVKEQVNAATAEMTTGIKSLTEAIAALRTQGTGRTHSFDQSGFAANGAPATLKLTGDIKSNASNAMWISALGLTALGRASMDQVDSIRYALDQKALSEGNLSVVPNTGSDLGTGGALAPVELNKQIIDYLWPNVVVRKAGAEAWNLQAAEMIMPTILNPSGSTWGHDPAVSPVPGFVGENGLIPATTMKFGQRSLRPQELATIVAVSRQLVVDSDPAVEAILRNALVQSIGTIEDRKFLLGGGTAPDIKGIFNYTAGDGAIVTDNGTTNLTYDNIIDMITSLMGNAVTLNKGAWIMSPVLFGSVRKIKDLDGRPLFVDYMNIQQGTVQVNNVAKVPSIMGMPVFLTQQLPTNLGAGANETMLALVDFDHIKIGQRGTLEITTSTDASYMDVASATYESSFQRNQILFRAIERVDIVSTIPQAIAIKTGITY